MNVERPLRVRAVLPHDVIGGAERWFLDVVDGIGDRWDLDAVVLGPGDVVANALSQRGLAVQRLPTGRRGRDIALTSARLAAALRRDRPDLLLCNGVKAAAAGVPAGWLAGVRTLWCKHDYAYDRRLGRVLGRAADGVVATSTELLAPLRLGEGVVIPPPLPPDPAPVATASLFWQAHGVDVGMGPVLAMVCRLATYKAVDIAIRALASPLAKEWRLVVVGPPEPSEPQLSEQLRRLAHEMGVLHRIQFTGQVPEAGRYLSAFSAVAVLTVDRPATRFTYEGFGIVVLESLSAGVPVISTPNVPATALGPEAVVRVGPESPDDVARALRQVGSLRTTATKVAKRLRLEHPGPEDVARRMLAAASEVARRPGAGSSAGPPVTVVTTVLDEVATMPYLLDDVIPQLRPGDELIVVDGGSNDGTQEVVRDRAGSAPVKLLVEVGASISAGRNIGARAARNNHIAFTDAGCAVNPHWLNGLRAAFRPPHAPDLVTGVYRASARSLWERAFAATSYPAPEEALHPSPLVRVYGAMFGRVFDPVLCTGRSMAVTKQQFERVGGFEESLATAEDVRFGREVAATGGRCILAVDAEVVWYQRASVRSTAKMYFGYGRGGGQSRDPLLIGRDAARLVAYTFAVAAALSSSRAARGTTAAGVLLQLSLPVSRVVQRDRSMAVLGLLPLTLVVKDVAKTAGCLVGFKQGWRPPDVPGGLERHVLDGNTEPPQV